MDWKCRTSVMEWTSTRVDQGITFEWGGLEFASRHLHGQYPQWGLEDADWWDQTTTDTETVPAPRGVRQLDPHLAPRSVTWTGLLEVDPRAADPRELLEHMNALRSATGDVLRVREGALGLYRELLCRPVLVQVTPLGATTATYTVTVQADDPLTYSADAVTISGTTTLRNDGNHDSYPLITVTGPTTSAPKITLAGKSFTAPKALTTGQVLELDCAESEMRINGARVYPLLATWPVITAGSSATCTVSPGSATARRVSAWR